MLKLLNLVKSLFRAFIFDEIFRMKNKFQGFYLKKQRQKNKIIENLKFDPSLKPQDFSPKFPRSKLTSKLVTQPTTWNDQFELYISSKKHIYHKYGYSKSQIELNVLDQDQNFKAKSNMLITRKINKGELIMSPISVKNELPKSKSMQESLVGFKRRKGQSQQETLLINFVDKYFRRKFRSYQKQGNCQVKSQTQHKTNSLKGSPPKLFRRYQQRKQQVLHRSLTSDSKNTFQLFKIN